MDPVVFGLIAGLVFGVLDVLIMIPLDLPDKNVAMLGAFFGQLAIGLLVPLVDMPWPTWPSECSLVSC